MIYWYITEVSCIVLRGGERFREEGEVAEKNREKGETT